MVGDSWLPRTSELRSLLTRNGVPHVFHPRDSEQGERLLRELGRAGTTEPVVLPIDGPPLIDPTNAELAAAYGVRTTLDATREFDLIVVGAGPARLAAAVYGLTDAACAHHRL